VAANSWINLIHLFIYYLKCRCEFKKNHGNWVREVKPNLCPEIALSVEKALETNK